MDLNTLEYKIDKQTSETINIAKSLAIIFVLYIHSYATFFYFNNEIIELNIPIWLDIIQYSFSKVIFEVGVPIFFFLSDLLLFKKIFPTKKI